MNIAQHIKETVLSVFRDRPLVIFLSIFFMLRVLAAAFVPLGADEAYYFDWSHAIHLSYYDHPPGVSWFAFIGQFIFGEGQTAARLGSIVAHFLSTLVLMSILRKVTTDALHAKYRIMALFTCLSPLLSIGGFLIMPDLGLILFLSLMLLAILLVLDNERLSLIDAVTIGALWGMAFNFKYHAIAIGGGALFALFTTRLSKLRDEMPFWITLTICPFLLAAPVFIWNYQHEWVSFLFQTAHGFADPSFNAKPAFQTLIAQMLLISPLTMYLYVKSFAQVNKSKVGYLFFWTTAPLGLLLLYLSFYKKVLPHWILPTVWLSLPIVVASIKSHSSNILKANFIYGSLITVIVTCLLGVPSLQEALLKGLNNKSGPLAELTVWKYIKEDQSVSELSEQLTAQAKGLKPHKACGKSMASFRWISTAQLAATFPEYKVFNLDEIYPSYYTYRDGTHFPSGCPVLLVGNVKHYREKYITSFVDIKESRIIKPKYHGDHKYFIASGIWK